MNTAFTRLVLHRGTDDLAYLFVAELEDGSHVEMVESVQPPFGRDEKWVLIVSTLKGCPIRCRFCDAGDDYRGRLSSDEIWSQLDFLVYRRYPNGRVPARKFKVQFARMGEPALNPAVLEVLEALPSRYDAPGLMPCISSVAPRGCERFMDTLLALKRRLFAPGRFQMQFSIHTTSQMRRRELIPVRTWSFAQMGAFGTQLVGPGDRKIALNFAAVPGYPLDPSDLWRWFSPAHFMIKLTPVNPTLAAQRRHLASLVGPGCSSTAELAARCEAAGYDTLVSVGEEEENLIGSNCGQSIASIRRSAEHGAPSLALVSQEGLAQLEAGSQPW